MTILSEDRNEYTRHNCRADHVGNIWRHILLILAPACVLSTRTFYTICVLSARTICMVCVLYSTTAREILWNPVQYMSILSEDRNKYTCCDCRADYAGNIRRHGVKEQVIIFIILTGEVLDHPGGIRYCRDAGSADQRIDFVF